MVQTPALFAQHIDIVHVQRAAGAEEVVLAPDDLGFEVRLAQRLLAVVVPLHRRHLGDFLALGVALAVALQDDFVPPVIAVIGCCPEKAVCKS